MKLSRSPLLEQHVSERNRLPSGLGQAPARQAAFGAGLGNDVPRATVNKMCGSAMQAHDAIRCGAHDFMIAGICIVGGEAAAIAVQRVK